MLRTLLVCGMLAGLAGGIVATGFASIAGEPAIERAIAFEEAQAPAAHADAADAHSHANAAHARADAADAHSHEADAALVPRDVQRSLGLVTAVAIYGLALGGLFALAFGAAYGRVATATPARTALWLAAAVFVVAFLVPFLKYPANPPAVGDPDTIDRRTGLFVVMVGCSLCAALAALRVRALLVRGRWAGGATLLAGAAYLAIVVAAGLALPGIHEVPRDFPAVTLWRFREASIGMQAVLWATLGLLFAWAAQRVMTGRPLAPWRAPATGSAVTTGEQ